MRTIPLLAALGLLAACGGGAPDARELAAYLADLKPLADLESGAVSAYKAVSGARFVDDRTLYNALLAETIPKYEVFCRALSNVRPAHASLSNLHRYYLAGADLQLAAFRRAQEYALTTAVEQRQLAARQLALASSNFTKWKEGIAALRSAAR